MSTQRQAQVEIANADRAQALAELQKTVAAHESADGVLFGTSAWLITARRQDNAR